ncbi:MAG: TetR/AcrR family transcriptional regulator [Gammaproteobacteria bacterium]|nr:MAG: TetR/AcrR family transcriptional regulator [Gammaproteobacteria bacterium]RLA53386.1 MAG: TetR/AcrR family transcriptional regulator [Gammaproteobacteria bacterium]
MKEQNDDLELERRNIILKAGMEVLFEYGYLGASVDEVVRRAGGSKRTVYKYFDNKEGLFAAIVANLVEQMMAPLQPEITDEKGLYDTLENLGQNYLSVLLQKESIAIFRIVVSEGARFPELGNALFESGPGVAVERLSKYLRRQTDLGVLKVNDAEAAARQYYGMIRSDLHMRALLGLELPDKEEIDEGISRAVDIFIKEYDVD